MFSCLFILPVEEMTNVFLADLMALLYVYSINLVGYGSIEARTKDLGLKVKRMSFIQRFMPATKNKILV